MRNRVFKALIGLLAVAIALAGLLGVLEQLSLTKPTDLSKISANPAGATGPGSKNAASNLAPGATSNIKLPPVPDISQPAEIDGSGSLAGLLPESLNLNLFNLSPNGLSPNISPQGGLPPHIPLFEVTGAGNVSYLRSMAHSLYENSTWEMEPSASFSSYLGERLIHVVKGFSKVAQHNIKITTRANFQFGPVILPISLYPATVSSPWPLNYYADEEAFISPQGMPDLYSFQSIDYSFDAAVLNQASVDPDTRYMNLPSTTPERIKQLAQTITQGALSPYQKAKAIESYLKKNYLYDYAYRPAPAGRDPDDWFLFEEKKGVCSNFNSAFVVLARSAGIPSRLVSGYAINPTSDKQTVYADQAHAWAEVKFKELGWINFDATGTASAPMIATRTAITSVSPLIRKGHTLTIQGTVLTSSGEPVNGVPVELFINNTKDTNGGTKIGQGMVSNGHFNIEAMISNQTNVGNYQLLAHSLGGIRYEHSWSDPPIKISTETRIDLSVPERVNISELNHFQGRLSEESNKAISGQKIDVTIDNRPTQHLVTNKDGQFYFDQIFTQTGDVTIKASFNNADFYLSSSQVSHIQVVIPTVLKLSVPSRAVISDSDIIQGTLVETQSKKPVSGEPIVVKLNGKALTAPVKTNIDGMFKVPDAFDKSGTYQIEASFTGVPYFGEARDMAVVEVSPLANSNNRIFIIAGLILLFLAAGGFIWFRWLIPKKPAAATNPLLSAAGIVPDLPADPITGNTKIALNIEFPEIGPSWPDVWGVGEYVQIVFTLINKDGISMAAKTLNIQIAENKFAISTNFSGRGSLTYSFPQKGQFIITAVYEEETGIELAAANRPIRVVDYREEIIDLYNALLEWLSQLRIDLRIEATPREVKEAVYKAHKRVPPEALNEAIHCFEEADYSLHPVIRKNYKTMYLAQKEILAHD
jgi:hypothetical protein